MTHATYTLRKRNDFVVKTGLMCLGKCISQEVTMKDLVQCRKLEAKFRQLAVSDPTKRLYGWPKLKNGKTRPKRKSPLTSKHAMLCELPVQLTNSHKI